MTFLHLACAGTKMKNNIVSFGVVIRSINGHYLGLHITDHPIQHKWSVVNKQTRLKEKISKAPKSAHSQGYLV